MVSSVIAVRVTKTSVFRDIFIFRIIFIVSTIGMH